MNIRGEKGRKVLRVQLGARGDGNPPHQKRLDGSGRPAPPRQRRLPPKLRGAGIHKTLEYAIYILCAVLIGAASVGIEDLLQMATQRSRSWFDFNPLFAFIVVPAAFWLAANLVFNFAPFAGGSGIPQVKRAIAESLEKTSSEQQFTKLCSLRTAGIKILSASVAIFGGASLGREGPMAQISAAIFQHINLFARRFGHQFRFEGVLSAGAAAGIAAAFNTPLGGITFALEELTQQGFGRVKQLLILAIIVAGITAQGLGGNHLFFGHWVSVQLPGQLRSMTAACFVGGICGLLGVFFCRLILWIRRKISELGPSVQRHLVPLSFGLLVALMGFLSDGRSFGTGYESTRLLLEEPGSHLPLWYPLAKFFSTVISFCSGAAGGIFAPSLAVGGATGNVLGLFFSAEFSVFFTLMGMAAWLAAITQAPLTAFVIVMEMTETHEAIIPLMLASLSAFAVAKHLMPVPLYHQLAEAVVLPGKSRKQLEESSVEESSR